MPKPLYVLDTDHLSLLQRAHVQVVTRLQQLPLDQRTTTVVNAEEQLRGRFAEVARAKRVDEWVIAYRQFQQTLRELLPLWLLPFDNAAAAEFVRLKASVKRVGTQDLKIAAIVLSVGGILVTRNQIDLLAYPVLSLKTGPSPDDKSVSRSRQNRRQPLLSRLH